VTVSWLAVQYSIFAYFSKIFFLIIDLILSLSHTLVFLILISKITSAVTTKNAIIINATITGRMNHVKRLATKFKSLLFCLIRILASSSFCLITFSRSTKDSLVLLWVIFS